MTTKVSKSKAVKPKVTKAKVCKRSKADLQGLNDYLNGNMSIWALYAYRKPCDC